MKAFIIDRYGKKEVGHISEMPALEVHDDEARIQHYQAFVSAVQDFLSAGSEQ